MNENQLQNLQFIWAGERNAPNQEVYFICRKKITQGKLILFAADFYQVKVNGKLISYGPERAVEGYARVRELSIQNAEEIEVRVVSYNVSTYCCDKQLPFFAARVVDGENILADTFDFECERRLDRNTNVPRYSFQRGFAEIYDLRNAEKEILTPYVVDTPILTDGVGDTANYGEVGFVFDGEKRFQGFDGVIKTPWWQDKPEYQPKVGEFNPVKEIAEDTVGVFTEYNYHLEKQAAGFIKLSGCANEETVVYAVFDEYLEDGKWLFRRSSCNDWVAWTIPKGKFEIASFEPYAVKFLKLLVKGKADITPSIITLQNDRKALVEMQGGGVIKTIFDAAVASFRHNAVDMYSDCPGRERAGWLFDSRFTALTEELLFRNRDLERNFLENFAIGDAPELGLEGMLPDCFPAQHDTGEFIPTYAMWYIIEVGEYYEATNDDILVAAVKEKAYALYRYFQAFENEYGLLEDLQGWIFVEWSEANAREFVSGVNFPSNMIYALMLEYMGKLYRDDALLEKAKKIRKTIKEWSFNGTFFADNATRENGKLVRRDDHISETCQYYAIVTGMDVDKALKEKLIKEFGLFRKDEYPNVVRSDVLPGDYMRFLWLCDIGECDRGIKECVLRFASMAEYSGTLWEKVRPTDSLDHGFASCAAVILVRALTGYKGHVNGKAVYGEKAKEDYGVKVVIL